jgi:uroporphyrinogen-III synthase
VADIPGAAAPLAGVGVLVTRPAHQAEPLARLIEQAGGVAIRFPTVAIAPPTDPNILDAAIDRLAEFDLAVFVSPNAIEHTLGRLLRRGGTWPAKLEVACVGRASARLLERFGIAHAITPQARFDSEGLLAHSALQQVAGRRVAVFRGDGGRELLGDTLRERGATVAYIECYRRLRPGGDVTGLLDRWQRGDIDVVSVTSAEGLRNLYDMVGANSRRLLLQTPIVVLSEAQAALCHQLGCESDVFVAPQASDEAILTAIQTWRRR